MTRRQKTHISIFGCAVNSYITMIPEHYAMLLYYKAVLNMQLCLEYKHGNVYSFIKGSARNTFEAASTVEFWVFKSFNIGLSWVLVGI